LTLNPELIPNPPKLPLVAGGRSQWDAGEDSAESTPEAQRERLVAAISRAAAEQGYEKLTVEHVVRYAGVPLATFYEHFATKEQGLMAAFDAFLDRLWLEVSAVCETESEWPEKVKAAVDVTLSYLVEASNIARVFAVEAATASLAATQRQLAALEEFATLLRDGRRFYPRAADLPAPTERALVGGIASIISGHLLAEEPQVLVDLEPELIELVLIPYLGQAEAKRVALG
jgi:AcrR family transcriptional regulator